MKSPLDATTAPGWEGSPVVYLDGSEAEIEGGTWGIRVRENSTAKIYGLGIGEFDLGIWFEPESSGRACGNFVGTDLTGTAAAAELRRHLGRRQARGSSRSGANAGKTAAATSSPATPSGGSSPPARNSKSTRNLVGTDASGEAPLPNGPDPEEVEAEGGGIRVGPNAIEVTVGGLDDQELPHNVVAFNRGPGVLVQNGALFATVRQNSIFANEGPGIESPATTVTAAITSVAEVVNGTTTVTGTIEGLPNRAYDLEFFSSEECDPSGFGQGRYFLASTGDEVETDDSGAAAFSATLLGLVLPEAHFFTLTATDVPKTGDLGVLELRLGGFRTGGKTDIPATSSAPAASVPTPVNGKSVTVAPKSGRVLIKLPGSNKFVPLGDLRSIPVGSIVDATNGRVTLTSVDANGVEQSADFYEGRFQISQAAGGALVTLRLRGGDFSSCPKAGSSARASKRSGRKLWGSGSGRFRTQGNFGSASVRGTIWLTADQCKGTFFKVTTGGRDSQRLRRR